MALHALISTNFCRHVMSPVHNVLLCNFPGNILSVTWFPKFIVYTNICDLHVYVLDYWQLGSSVWAKSFHCSSDICLMGFIIYFIQICELRHQTYGPSHWKCPIAIWNVQHVQRFFAYTVSLYIWGLSGEYRNDMPFAVRIYIYIVNFPQF